MHGSGDCNICNIIVQNIIFLLITETSNSSLQLTEPTMECNQASAATICSAFLRMMADKFLNGHNYTSVAITDHEWSSSAHCADMQAMGDDVNQWRVQLDETLLAPYPCRCFHTLWIDRLAFRQLQIGTLVSKILMVGKD